MSKFLRFIVNLFIVVAVLTAAAILIPPLAGVSTTIVDSASMDTNLPLGSITYARSVERSSVAAGDEVLRVSAGSVYAYVIEDVGENGTYTAVSAADDSAAAQTIELDDPVLRVAVVVPLIGYVVMALQSTEGILILVLIAVLVIVLFILSELWKPDGSEDDEDEDAEEESPVEAEPAVPEITAPDDGGIDTDVIRRAMNENNSELAKPDPDASFAYRSGAQEEAARGTDEVRGTVSGRTENAAFGEAAPETEAEGAALAGAGAEAAAEYAVPSAQGGPEAEMPLAGDAEPAADSSSVTGGEDQDAEDAKKKKSWRERRAEKKAKKKAEKEEKRRDAAEETPYAEEAQAVESAGFSGEAPAEEAQAAENAGFSGEASAEEAQAAENAGFSGEAPAEEKQTADTQDESEAASPDAAGEAAAAEKENTNQAADSAQPYDPDRFIPVNRPTLGELLDEARKSGDKPKVREDEATGITTVDYTDVI